VSITALYALAKAAGIPNQATIRDIERGKDVKLSSLQSVAAVLGLKLELTGADHVIGWPISRLSTYTWVARAESSKPRLQAEFARHTLHLSCSTVKMIAVLTP